MANEDKTIDVTQDLPPDLIPTERFDPILSSTVSIVQYVEAKEGESPYQCRRIVIRKE